MQPGLVDAIARKLSPNGSIYLSSDVHEVAVDMRRRFEVCAGASLRVSKLHDQQPTFSKPEEHLPRARAPAGEVVASDSSAQHEPSPPPSEWAANQWLQDNPTGLPTEREQSVLRRGLPMYRLVLSHKR